MSASTTVGFNTVPIGALSHATLLVMFFLMAIGASPSGTGGGIKTTSFAAMVGLVRSTLKQRAHVRLFKRRIAASRLQAAGATFFYFMILLTLAMFLLSLTEPGASFEVMVFECISALGTVGISMGLTGDLSVLGKLIIIILMTAGRVGILSLGRGRVRCATSDAQKLPRILPGCLDLRVCGLYWPLFPRHISLRADP